MQNKKDTKKIDFFENERGGDLVCNNLKLKKTGWKPKYSFKKIISQFK